MIGIEVGSDGLNLNPAILDDERVAAEERPFTFGRIVPGDVDDAAMDRR